jgi:DNA-binding MarR family transcriptional regulator
MSDKQLADAVWRSMAAVVFDNRDVWRRSVIERTGLPFSRVRVLRRLAKRPMTAKEIAVAASMDAPATSVSVNDLENRGLVVREAVPTNRRCKVISLTEKGRSVLDDIDALEDPAPPAFAGLSAADLERLQAILAKLTATELQAP